MRACMRALRACASTDDGHGALSLAEGDDGGEGENGDPGVGDAPEVDDIVEEPAPAPEEAHVVEEGEDDDEDENDAAINAAVQELVAHPAVRDLVDEVTAALAWKAGARSAEAPEGLRRCWRFLARRVTFIRASGLAFRAPTLVPQKAFAASYIHVPTSSLRRHFLPDAQRALLFGRPDEHNNKAGLWSRCG